MAEAAVEDADTGLSHSPLVTVSFQKNEQRKLKFLEGEPKALGVGLSLLCYCLPLYTINIYVPVNVQITQICLTLFHGSCIAALKYSGINSWHRDIQYHLIASVFVLIGGSLAIAAKNLHLPTLRACLGMEILSSVACLVNVICTQIQMVELYCYYALKNQDKQDCENGRNAHTHLFAELMLIHVTLFAISVTLVVYACKVVNCCSPAPKVPVIMIQAPPAPQ